MRVMRETLGPRGFAPPTVRAPLRSCNAVQSTPSRSVVKSVSHYTGALSARVRRKRGRTNARGDSTPLSTGRAGERVSETRDSESHRPGRPRRRAGDHRRRAPRTEGQPTCGWRRGAACGPGRSPRSPEMPGRTDSAFAEITRPARAVPSQGLQFLKPLSAHFRARSCASAIRAGVSILATTSRCTAAWLLPVLAEMLNHMCAIT